ncbi:hypothetical protein KSC_109720 [Ktedonobacter sp. SOSP1-52]|nr:hypothetical protein KSC_109720 [Ktedonobacter sp. SOSP1-52]
MKGKGIEQADKGYFTVRSKQVSANYTVCLLKQASKCDVHSLLAFRSQVLSLVPKSENNTASDEALGTMEIDRVLVIRRGP